MNPPSFYVNFLLLLWLFSRKHASFFYPYVYFTSILGIIYSSILLCFQSAQDFHSYFFSNSSINYFQDHWKTFYLLYVILYKALLIYIYPFNMSKESIIYSFNYFMFYICCSLSCIYMF